MRNEVDTRIQCRHVIPALNARVKYTTARLIAIQFPGHRCDHKSLTSQLNVALIRVAIWVINVLGVVSMGACTTRHWQTSSRLVQNLEVCTITGHLKMTDILKRTCLKYQIEKKVLKLSLLKYVLSLHVCTYFQTFWVFIIPLE